MSQKTPVIKCGFVLPFAMLLLIMQPWGVADRGCMGQERVARRGETVVTSPEQREHPLAGPLRWAQQNAWTLENEIRDYTCTLFMRKGSGEAEQIFLKVRHQPFSIYMYYLAPDKARGREVLFVENQRDGKFLAHEGHGLKSLVGSVKLQVSGKYPLRNLGVKYLNERLIELASDEIQLGKCDVLFYPDVKIGTQEAYCVQVAHRVRSEGARMPLARAFFDKRTGIPFRYEGYAWPDRGGESPVLNEEYTYLNLKFNVGLTEWDFDSRNPDYSF